MTLDICPLCEQPINDGELFVEVRTGGQQPPGARHVVGTAPVREEIIGYFDRTASGMEVLGYDIGQLAAILDAMRNFDGIEIDVKRGVEVVYQIGQEAPAAIVEGAIPMDTRTDRLKVDAEVTIEPWWDPPEPDHLMHAECHDSLFGVNDDG